MWTNTRCRSQLKLWQICITLHGTNQVASHVTQFGVISNDTLLHFPKEILTPCFPYWGPLWVHFLRSRPVYHTKPHLKSTHCLWIHHWLYKFINSNIPFQHVTLCLPHSIQKMFAQTSVVPMEISSMQKMLGIFVRIISKRIPRVCLLWWILCSLSVWLKASAWTTPDNEELSLRLKSGSIVSHTWPSSIFWFFVRICLLRLKSEGPANVVAQK